MSEIETLRVRLRAFMFCYVALSGYPTLSRVFRLAPIFDSFMNYE